MRLGLIDELLPADDLEKHTYEFARLVTTRAQFSVRSAKRIVDLVVEARRPTTKSPSTSAIRPSTPRTMPKAFGLSSRSGRRGSRGHDHHRFRTFDTRPGRGRAACGHHRRPGVRTLLPHPLPRPVDRLSRRRAIMLGDTAFRFAPVQRGRRRARWGAVDRTRHLDGPCVSAVSVGRIDDPDGDAIPAPCQE